MNQALADQLAGLEEEFARAESTLAALRRRWEQMREYVRPTEEEMAECEQAMDEIRHNARYRELAARLPHLRRAVLEDAVR